MELPTEDIKEEFAFRTSLRAKKPKRRALRASRARPSSSQDKSILEDIEVEKEEFKPVTRLIVDLMQEKEVEESDL